MRNELAALALLGCIGLQAAAVAGTTAEDLTKIESETAVLKARAKQLEVQAQIAGKQAEIAAKQSDMRRSAHPASASDPVVQSIEGVGETVYASVELAGGRLVDVKAGDTLNGARVVSIRSNEVIIETATKRRVRLVNGSRTATPPGPFGQGGMAAPMSLSSPLPTLRGTAP